MCVCMYEGLKDGRTERQTVRQGGGTGMGTIKCPSAKEKQKAESQKQSKAEKLEIGGVPSFCFLLFVFVSIMHRVLT